jgi:hypothetical protein
MSGDWIRGLVEKSYDLHFHIGPDILPRKYTVEELVETEAGKVCGIALKSHSFPTIALINAVKEFRGLDLIGSVTLNYFMGGFNESAIYSSSVMSQNRPIIVWMPTVHAENHLIKNKSDYEIPPEWIKDPQFRPRKKDNLKAIKVTDWAGKLIRKANSCMKTMVDAQSIVATGHLSWKEAERLAMETLDRGIKTIITHPMQRDIAMPLDVQMKLADRGAYIEYCYIMYLDRDNPGDYPLEKQVEAMEAIGKDRVLITSDGGQKSNPGPSQCLTEYIGLLEENGMKKADIESAVVDNPKRILGL